MSNHFREKKKKKRKKKKGKRKTAEVIFIHNIVYEFGYHVNFFSFSSFSRTHNYILLVKSLLFYLYLFILNKRLRFEVQVV